MREKENIVRKAFALIVVALVIGIFPLKAQEQSRRALAEEMINVMEARTMFEKNISLVRKMMQNQAGQLSQITGQPNASSNLPQVLDKTFDIFSQYFTWDKLKDNFISLYVETFTEDEMKGIIGFYKSSSGQALLQKQPQLMQRTIEISQKLVAEMMPKIKELATQPPK
jgi:uncharacterized protein